jgi:hypothetical protein
LLSEKQPISTTKPIKKTAAKTSLPRDDIHALPIGQPRSVSGMAGFF